MTRTPKPDLEGLLCLQLKAVGLPAPEREVQLFLKPRWRYDLVFREARVVVEVQGGTWTYRTGIAGAHSRGKGQTRDCRKQNRAAIEGWLVLTFTSDMVLSGEALDTLILAFRCR